MAYLASAPALFTMAVNEHRRWLEAFIHQHGSELGIEAEEVLEFLRDLQGEAEAMDAISNYQAALLRTGEPSRKSIRRLRETARDLTEMAEAAG